MINTSPIRENGMDVLDITITLNDNSYYQLSKVVKKGEFYLDLSYTREIKAGTDVNQNHVEDRFIHVSFMKDGPDGPLLLKRVSYAKDNLRSIEVVHR